MSHTQPAMEGVHPSRETSGPWTHPVCLLNVEGLPRERHILQPFLLVCYSLKGSLQHYHAQFFAFGSISYPPRGASTRVAAADAPFLC